MSSSITLPKNNLVGAQAVLDALVAVATSATTDINALQAGTAVAAATTSAAGTQSAADKKFEDGLHSAAGTGLTDTSTQTIQITGGTWRTLATISQDSVLTVGTTGAVAGDQLTISRRSTDAKTYSIVNGGTGAGTLYVMANSKIGFAMLQFDGTDWALKTFGVQ